jgi:ureidoacrylate peracid hydrolase
MTLQGPSDRATYKLSRNPEMDFPVGTTAVLVIDPVNDFLSERGAAWDMTKLTVQKNDVIPNLKRLIEGARARGIPVIFGPMAYTEEDYAEAELHRRTGINRIMFERRMFLAGSWGADFHPDLQPEASDIVLMPHKGTDVFQTDLPEHLDRLGTTHLVIAGMTANLCCESTGRHAAEAGYDVTFLSDAIGSESLPSYEAAIRVNYPLIGNAVMLVDEFLAAIDSGAGEFSIEPGDVVRGSDHGEIGKVAEVVQATDDHDAYLRVPQGMILKQDLYIPLDAAVHRSGSVVFVNVPKLVVGKVGWDAVPTPRARRERLGPRAADVANLYQSRSPTSAGERAGGGSKETRS